MTIENEIQSLVPEITEWRHQLHSWPETAFEEVKTSDFIAEKLISFGLTVHRGMARTGVVGTLESNPKGCDAIGLRADMDALHIQEENEIEYRSTNPGKMHACGHDGHTAMLLGAAKLLSQKPDFKGTVHFIFQPAEEKEAGGRAMVEDGLFEKYPVKSVFGIHNFPVLPLGFFATKPGPLMAATDGFELMLKGGGGHTAMPHLAKDAILAGSHMVSQIQSIVSRDIDPGEAAVITVTDFHAGNYTNIIPDEVTIRGITRLFQPHVQQTIKTRLREIIEGIATSMGIDCDFNYFTRYPAVVNSPAETEAALRAASEVVGSDRVLTEFPPIMGSEDFSFMLQKKPGTFIGLGFGVPEKGGMLHQSTYDFNDELIPLGVAYWQRLVKNLLPV